MLLWVFSLETTAATSPRTMNEMMLLIFAQHFCFCNVFMSLNQKNKQGRDGLGWINKSGLPLEKICLSRQQQISVEIVILFFREKKSNFREL